MASIPLDREFIAWADTKKVWRPGTQVADNTVKGWYAQYVRDAVVQPDASVRLLERERSDMWARITKDPSVSPLDAVLAEPAGEQTVSCDIERFIAGLKKEHALGDGVRRWTQEKYEQTCRTAVRNHIEHCVGGCCRHATSRDHP